MDSSRPKRSIIKPSRFSEDNISDNIIDNNTYKNNNKYKLNNNKRQKNQANTDVLNKWESYKKLINKCANIIRRELHYIEGYETDKKQNHQYVINNNKSFNKEITICQNKIVNAKKTILNIFNAVEDENKDHKRWLELEEEDEDGLIDIDGILCSVCNKQDTPNNDILICDRKGCNRAYHEKCLDPPLILNLNKELQDMSLDWFCWQCETINDCILIIKEILDINTKEDSLDWRDLFPEIDEKSNNYEQNVNISKSFVIEDDDEEHDEDYLPDSIDEYSDNDDSSDSDSDSDVNSSYSVVADEDNQLNNESDNVINSNLVITNDDSIDNKDSNNILITATDKQSISDCDLDSNIDEDEYNNLILESGVDSDQLQRPGYYFRDRKPIAKVAIGPYYSVLDLYRKIAKVNRGIIITGAIVNINNPVVKPLDEVSSENGSDYFPDLNENGDDKNDEKSNINKFYWHVRYDNDTDEIIDEDTFKKGLYLFSEYETLLSNRRKINKGANESDPLVDSKNVIPYKRSRKLIDYVSLSLAMFGNLKDEDDDVNNTQNMKRIKPPRPHNPRNSSTSSSVSNHSSNSSSLPTFNHILIPNYAIDKSKIDELYNRSSNSNKNPSKKINKQNGKVVNNHYSVYDFNNNSSNHVDNLDSIDIDLDMVYDSNSHNHIHIHENIEDYSISNYSEKDDKSEESYNYYDYQD